MLDSQWANRVVSYAHNDLKFKATFVLALNALSSLSRAELLKWAKLCRRPDLEQPDLGRKSKRTPTRHLKLSAQWEARSA